VNIHGSLLEYFLVPVSAAVLNTPSLPYETLLQRLWFLVVKQLYIMVLQITDLKTIHLSYGSHKLPHSITPCNSALLENVTFL